MSRAQAGRGPHAAGKWSRRARRLGVGLLALAVLLGVGWATRARWLGPWLVDLLAGRVRESTGLELEVGAIGGDWWSELELRDVALAGGRPRTMLRELRIGRVLAKYDLRALLRGDPAGLATVEIETALIDLDTRVADPRPPGPPTGRPFPWPALVPLVDARDVDLTLALGGGQELRLLGASALHEPAPSGQSARWRVRAERFGFLDPHFGERDWPAEAVVDYAGGQFASARLELGGEVIGTELELDLRGLASGEAAFGATVDVLGGRHEARGRIAGGELALWLDAHGLELSPLFRELRLQTTLAGRATLAATWQAPLHDVRRWQACGWGRVEDLAFQGRAFDLLDFSGRADCERVELQRGLLIRGANEIEVAGFGFSIAKPDFDDLVRSLTGTAQARLHDPEAILADAPVEVLRAARRVQRAEVRIECSRTGFTLGSGRVDTDVGGLSFERAQLSFGSRGAPWWRGLELDVDALISFEDLAPLAALFGRGGVTGALSGSVSLSGPLLRPVGRCALSGERLAVFGFPVGSATIEASSDLRHLRLSRLEVDGELARLSAAGFFDYATGEISSTRASLTTLSLDRLTGGRASAGFAHVDAVVSGPWRKPRVFAHAQAFELEYGERRLEQLEVQALYENGCAVVNSLSARVGGVDVDAVGHACHGSDAATWRVGLDSARLERDGLDLALESAAEIAVQPGEVVVRNLCVGGSAGRATIELRWTAAEQQGSIDASDLQPMPLLAPFLPDGVVIDGVQGSLSFRRAGGRIDGEASLRVADLRPFAGSPPATLSIDGRLAEQRLELRQIVLSAPGHFALAATARLPVEPRPGQSLWTWLGDGPLELSGEANWSDLASLPREALGLAEGWRGGGDLTFRLEGTTSHVRGSFDASVDVTAAPADSVFGRAHTGSVRFEGLATLGEELLLEEARIVVSDRATATLTGGLGVQVDLRRWLAERRVDWRALPVRLAARIDAGDLAFVAEMLSPHLRRTGGALRADLTVGGTLGAPELLGTATLERGELRLANSLAPLENVNGRFELSGTTLQIAWLAGEYGAAPLSATGSLEFADGVPRLDLRLNGKGILLARDEGVRLRADATLKLAGALDDLLLSGNVEIVEGRISRDFPLISLPGSGSTRRTRQFELPYLREAPWANIAFDVAVTAQKPVRVETNVARGTVDPELVLSGIGAAPQLSGTMVVGSTRIKLPASVLEVTSGVLTFRGSGRLVPDLDITAVTRVRGYDITAQISGTSAEPELLFTSSPPLASEELAVLVLTGQLPESALTAQGSEAAVQTVAVYLGRDILTRWLGIEGDSEDPISERFEFYRGAEVSRTGIESTEFIFRLTPNPKGKSRILYLRAEQDIYGRVNFGVKLLFRFQ